MRIKKDIPTLSPGITAASHFREVWCDKIVAMITPDPERITPQGYPQRI
jgi:hypothetical protein